MTTKSQSEQPLPAGWPNDVSFPTTEEVKEAIRKGEEKLAQELEENKDKIKPLNREALDTVIDI